MGAAIKYDPEMDQARVVSICLGIRRLVQQTGWFEPSLGEACTLTSCLIADALSVVHQEPTTLVGGEFKTDWYFHGWTEPCMEPHVWLTWNGFILDATATQFDIPDEVYLTDNDDRYHREESVPVHSFGEFNKDNVWVRKWSGWNDDYELLVRQARKIAEGL